MNEWTHGYVSEVDYLHAYFREISPAYLKLGLLAQHQAHRVGRPLRYLELGYGQGLSLNIHAAANVGEFWGTDFNPSHAANARDLAAASGANLHCLDDSFEELARRDDLPEFDIITLHGVWSWINDEDRRAIVSIVRRRLAVGGIFYVSYNCTPGWSSLMPLRELMVLHARHGHDTSGDITQRIDGSVAFAEKIAAANALYFRTPGALDWLRKVSHEDRRYVAHEYFNESWSPMPFSRVAKILEEAKVGFAATAEGVLRVDSVNLSPEGQTLLASIPNPILRESVRDYFTNTLFRRDIFVKGPRSLSPLERTERLQALRFHLVSHREQIVLKVRGALGEGNLLEAIYAPIIERFIGAGASPLGIDDLLATPDLASISREQVTEALLVLVSNAHLFPAQADGDTPQVRQACQQLNRALIAKARHRHDDVALACPLTGSGIAVSRMELLFTGQCLSASPSAADLADSAWKTLADQNQRVMKEGRPMESKEDNLAELNRLATAFLDQRLPLFRRLQLL